VPRIRGRKAPTSEVFDFSFDLNIKQKRQDASNIKMRVDYSNANGYWGNLVDSPGTSNSAPSLYKRYWAELPADWRDVYGNAKDLMFVGTREDGNIKETIEQPLFWDDVSNCQINGESYSQGFGAYVGGTIDAEFSYGFSMIVCMTITLEAGKW
jgi:chitinase